MLPFDTDLEESFWGAGIAFVHVVVVGVRDERASGRPKRAEELRGLVYGMGGVDLKGDVIAGDAAWYRSPLLLGGVALALSIALYIPVVVMGARDR